MCASFFPGSRSVRRIPEHVNRIVDAMKAGFDALKSEEVRAGSITKLYVEELYFRAVEVSLAEIGERAKKNV